MQRRRFLAFGAVAVLGGCAALPRSGPLTVDMDPLDDEGRRALAGLVIALTADVADSAPRRVDPGFSASLRTAQIIEPTVLGVDDRLDVIVWEADGGGLFNPRGGATMISGLQVQPSGAIRMPYVGGVPAHGDTPAVLADRIREALQPLTLGPAVEVRLASAESRLVTVLGAVAQPGVYPIDRATARIAGMIASAGGAVGMPEAIDVTVVRQGDTAITGRELLSAILADPGLDIALRPGDRVVLNPIRERFIALGASSIQAEIPFPSRPFDLLSAIAAARGLRDFDADPSGIFVLRYEDPDFADAVLDGPPPPGLPAGEGRPIVYRLDMTTPSGIFVARRFPVLDGDVIFATNAPLTEVRKFLQLFNSVVAPVNTIGATPAL